MSDVQRKSTNDRVQAAGKSAAQQVHHHQSGQEQNLKGAFISVLLLAAFIGLSWIGVFYLFIDRM